MLFPTFLTIDWFPRSRFERYFTRFATVATNCPVHFSGSTEPKDARVSFRNILLGLGKSDIDVGSAAFFAAEGTRGEIMTRAIVTDKASFKMRGKLWGRKLATRGHLECRALVLSDEAQAFTYLTLQTDVKDTELSHEAAVGKIAEDQLYYLMTRGLTEDEATSLITRGFLDIEVPGLPKKLLNEIKRIIAMTAERVL